VTVAFPALLGVEDLHQMLLDGLAGAPGVLQRRHPASDQSSSVRTRITAPGSRAGSQLLDGISGGDCCDNEHPEQRLSDAFVATQDGDRAVRETVLGKEFRLT
jgi:hypothetical protein